MRGGPPPLRGAERFREGEGPTGTNAFLRCSCSSLRRFALWSCRCSAVIHLSISRSSHEYKFGDRKGNGKGVRG